MAVGGGRGVPVQAVMLSLTLVLVLVLLASHTGEDNCWLSPAACGLQAGVCLL